MIHLSCRIALVVLCAALLRTPTHSNELPPTVLVLDQAGPGLLAYADMTAHFRSALNRETNNTVAVYAESLDLSRFGGEAYRKIQTNFLREKYRNIDIGVILALGTRAVESALNLSADIWPGIPIVFAAVPDGAIDVGTLPPNVTGHTIRVSLRSAITAANAVSPPAAKRVALIGDPLPKQTFRFHFVKELEEIRSSVDVIDLTGLPMRQIMERVAQLPEDSVIVYTTINVDGEGKAFLPTDALERIAAVANRPIIVDIERQVGFGATGGFVVITSQIGELAGLLTARLFNGDAPSSIPITLIDAVKPVFDWKQLQRWKVNETDLPPGSEIRFREHTIWEQYRWIIMAIGLAILIQTASILGLLYEDRRRRAAEASNQQLLGRISHLNRVATAGELTASIAHEVRQPLAAIVASGSAALNWLKRSTPNIEEAQVSLLRIVKEVHRADDVIKNVRAMFSNETPPRDALDVNDAIRQVIGLAERRIISAGIALKATYANPSPVVWGNSIQMQQVFVNLILNAVEAMASAPAGERRLIISSAIGSDSVAVIRVEDTGHGLAKDQLENVFKAFVTTKPGGMGLGLAICKSIIEAHGGKITAMAGASGGTTFEIILPLQEQANEQAQTNRSAA